jgi:hypothetical protein
MIKYKKWNLTLIATVYWINKDRKNNDFKHLPKKKIVHKSSVCKSLNSYLYNFKATDVIYSFFTKKKRSAGFYAENYISRRKFTFYMDFNCKAYE